MIFCKEIRSFSDFGKSLSNPWMIKMQKLA